MHFCWALGAQRDLEGIRHPEWRAGENAAWQQSAVGVGSNAQIRGEPRLWGSPNQAEGTFIYQMPPRAGPAVREDSGFHVISSLP